jgi:hypothetical protein
MATQAAEFYDLLAVALIAEVTNTNIRVRIANRLANVFELADTPDSFPRAAWIERVRLG